MLGGWLITVSILLVVEASKAHGIFNGAYLVLGLDQEKLNQILKSTQILSELGFSSSSTEVKKVETKIGTVVKEQDVKEGVTKSVSVVKNSSSGSSGTESISSSGVSKTVLSSSSSNSGTESSSSSSSSGSQSSSSSSTSSAESSEFSYLFNANYTFNVDTEKIKNEKCFKYVVDEKNQDTCHKFLSDNKLEKVEDLEFNDFFELTSIYQEEIPKISGFGDIKGIFEKRSPTFLSIWQVLISFFQEKITWRTSRTNDQTVQAFKDLGAIGLDWAKNVSSLWEKTSDDVKSNIANLCNTTTQFVKSNATQKIISITYTTNITTVFS
ncbi:unnamed protein product [Bursaphelenchus okinawaensis]|uniref:Uncharacterized protein n=1 Tax=Bursaphelenchus okinawaensis TaxID=465554 RepID=A0A811LP20_9BILA|nr:unnamed protein product [Bursaphelenchus okinawaensis]CAG9125108.1 unnamed protein product [Bursaphelenchus okinawaensis]